MCFSLLSFSHLSYISASLQYISSASSHLRFLLSLQLTFVPQLKFSLASFQFPCVSSFFASPCSFLSFWSLKKTNKTDSVKIILVAPIIRWRFAGRKWFIIINRFWLNLFVWAHQQLKSLYFVCCFTSIHSIHHMYLLPEDYIEAWPWN